MIRKQLVIAALLGLIGLGLLFAGLREPPGGAVKPAPAGAPVASLVPPGSSAGAGGGSAAGSGGAAVKGTAGGDGAAAPAAANASRNGEAFFVEYRLDRERTRGEQLALLKEIVDNAATGGETRQRAQDRLLTISQNMAREMEVENLIRAKGYADAAVCLENGGATVIVEAKQISSTGAARIADLVARNTGVSAQNIVIIPRQ